jgi:hypothetical protein
MPKHTINPAPGRATSWGGLKYLPGEEVEIPDALVKKLTKRGVIGEVAPSAANAGDEATPESTTVGVREVAPSAADKKPKAKKD